jgi:head-tail adaptor
MRIGERRQKVTIQVPVQTKDKFSAVTVVWNTFAVMWVAIETLKGFDKSNAAANYPGADVKITMKYFPGVLPTMRIVYLNQIYSILGQPENVDMRNRDLIFTCQTGVKAS